MRLNWRQRSPSTSTSPPYCPCGFWRTCYFRKRLNSLADETPIILACVFPGVCSFTFTALVGKVDLRVPSIRSCMNSGLSRTQPTRKGLPLKKSRRGLYTEPWPGNLGSHRHPQGQSWSRGLGPLHKSQSPSEARRVWEGNDREAVPSLSKVSCWHLPLAKAKQKLQDREGPETVCSVGEQDTEQDRGMRDGSRAPGGRHRDGHRCLAHAFRSVCSTTVFLPTCVLPPKGRS